MGTWKAGEMSQGEWILKDGTIFNGTFAKNCPAVCLTPTLNFDIFISAVSNKGLQVCQRASLDRLQRVPAVDHLTNLCIGECLLVLMCELLLFRAK